MEKDATLFTRLNKAEESRIYVVDDFSLDVVGQGDVACRHGKIVEVYNLPNISVNLLFVSQLTQNGKIVEFLLDRDLNKGNSIVVDTILDPMDNLYKFFDLNRHEFDPTALISHIDERIRI
jgi:hypothetical protein